MAKISPASIKYMISADFVADGPLEKPDVIGALFGQTEGLLGSDMELRELQKEGKIGRIDVEIECENGKTKGKITIPSALDKTETTIIAAALETIDKIGPTDAKISITEIEDVRRSKREYIMERAKKLLASIKGSEMDTQEIEKELKESIRTSKITEYGEERLPAGDLSGKEIIVVEGRADVINMLKHGFENVVGMNGAKLPKTISKLGEEKEITLFVDGDRGGKLIARNVCENAKIKYIATAPDGKEVEELTSKEIHQALRKKVSVKEFLKSTKNFGIYGYGKDEKIERSKKKLKKEDKEKLRELMEEVRGRNVLVLDEDLNVIRNVPASRLGFLRVPKPVYALVTNIATNSIVDSAVKLGAKYVAAKSFGNVETKGIELVSL